ncbi:MAG: Na+/H+ antiporter subunit A [Candidatus Pristimantibacillus lignocellulolyticus]|uniref:Na+/H+ antiporter subunit A n=1 Tax=Candidatus Pristimantibacillus lignocellulolyticus TaxID=2994561 RepID=A0A9J6ZK39_9BACL|nr:MAG: Na+/H+ antiporter subunit A [Candidatus Pristimantibacillus lignocellulolyticus]
MSTLHLAILLPFVFVVIIPLLYKYTTAIHTGWIALIVPVALFVYFAGYFSIYDAIEPIKVSVPWIPSIDIHFTLYLDSLSLLFALLITGIGSLVVLYSIFYLSKDRERLHLFYAYLMLFMGAMLGSVLSDNLLVLYTFWELTSVSSFLLIAYWYQRQRSRYGAQKAMYITMTGGFSMLLGFIILYVASGTFSIREIIAMGDSVSTHYLFIPAMFFILLGAFTKSAQFPFHIWLPDAMEAPTPISAYLHSATMVKAGVYLVARMTPIFGALLEWSWTIIVVGIVTLFWGSFNALKQYDLKALLAYSTISQLGLIMSLLGVGSMGMNIRFENESLLFMGAFLAAIFHLINHSVFKGSLFMMVGILDHETGTRDIRKLGGIMHLMPISFTLTMVGAFSMAGLPPFSGFISKEMFFTSMLTLSENNSSWVNIIPVVAWIASIFTFIYCMIIIFKSFTGTYHANLLERVPHEAPVGMLASPATLSILAIALFLFPGLVVTSILEPTVKGMAPTVFAKHPDWHAHITAWHGLNLELFMTIGLIIIGILLFLSIEKWKTPIFSLMSKRYNLNQIYDKGMINLEKFGTAVTRSYMTGSTTHYLTYIFCFLIITVLGTLLVTNSFYLDTSNDSPIEWYEFVLGIATVAAAVFVLFSTSRLMSIMGIGVIGFTVSLFFVIFRAPDLALTQLVVETISTTLFLLCFYFLPKLKTSITSLKFKLTNAIIALGVGTTLTLIGLSAYGHRIFVPIAEYFHDSYKLAGAKNIVNSILVDFRAFDTMLEIVVLFSAGIGIYTLIKLRHAGRND